jgi:hypothetical protein
MSEISKAPRQQVVERYYSVAFGQQTIAHVRSDETGGTGNDDTQIPSKPSF